MIIYLAMILGVFALGLLLCKTFSKQRKLSTMEIWLIFTFCWFTFWFISNLYEHLIRGLTVQRAIAWYFGMGMMYLLYSTFLPLGIWGMIYWAIFVVVYLVYQRLSKWRYENLKKSRLRGIITNPVLKLGDANAT